MKPRGGGKPPCDFLQGFTLIELVLVILLLGILAIVVLPRFNDTGFREYGYAEEALSALRYARQIAIANNAHVTVQWSADAFRVCRGDTCPGAGYLINPSTGQPWDGSAEKRGKAPAGVSISSTLTAVTFDGLGRPNASGGVSIGAHTLTIEAETGYVH